MKKQYVIPSVEVVNTSAVLMQSGSGTRQLQVNGSETAGAGTFADGKDGEISSGSIWGEEE